MARVKAYFACSMRGGYGAVSQEELRLIAGALEEIDLELMSRHQTQEGILQQEDKLTSVEVHDRDYRWLVGCDLVVAELSNLSFGVGAEVSDAIQLGKPVIGLYKVPENSVSKYIKGKLESYKLGRHARYESLDDLKQKVGEFVNSVVMDAMLSSPVC